jgi:gliding motility-associated-like protein
MKEFKNNSTVMNSHYFHLMRFFKAAVMLFFLLSFRNTWGQGQDNIWVFGFNAGLDFSTLPPTGFGIASNPNYYEGSASVSDAAGNLLMSSEGFAVRDRNHNIMPNGNNLVPSGAIATTTQACVIVPYPGSATRYYLFSLEPIAGSFNRLLYSVVDMSLNGGLGDVVPGQKGIVLDNSLTEKMTAVTNHCDRIWIMTRSLTVNQYKAYEITTAGLNTTPVISPVGLGPLGSYAGTIKFSPDGKKMAAAAMAEVINGISFVELYDFDINTGLLSNPRTLQSSTPGYFYAVCFSPDNTKLYTTSNKLEQYDVSLPTTAQIVASRVLIQDMPTETGDLRLGPDGKIYMPSFENERLHRIEYPDLAGTACQFVLNAIILPTFVTGSLGLPNVVVTLDGTASDAHTMKELIACDSQVLKANKTADVYEWNTGEGTGSITVKTAGTYWVKYTTLCGTQVDTFKVAFVSRPLVSLGADTLICDDVSLNLTLSAAIPEHFECKWSTGAVSPSITVTEFGTYWVNLSYKACTGGDSITISRGDCGCALGIPTAFTPNDDGVNDVFAPVFGTKCNQIDNYQLRIFNRWGAVVYENVHPNKGWNGIYNGMKGDVGTYMYEITYRNKHNGKKQVKKGDFQLLQ